MEKAMIYKITYTDHNGNLYDVQYCCTESCLRRYQRFDTPDSFIFHDEQGLVEAGLVVDPDESDNDTYCADCGELIRKGIGR
jgi:hypothetical protein